MVVVDASLKGVATSQTPEQRADLLGRTNRSLLQIVRDNVSAQYASNVASLAEFRNAVSTHSVDIDATLLADFRSLVPLSNYDSYKPFVDKFDAQPCKEEDVENMFSPGFPDFFALSSATSGTTPKVLPKYNHNARLNIQTRGVLDPNSEDPIAVMANTGYREVKEIKNGSGEVVQRIPVCLVSGGVWRRTLGWYIDDESRLSLKIPGYAAPWAATIIGHLPSSFVIHGLFFLARRNVSALYMTFAPLFIDLIRHIDEQWDTLVSCIRDGTIPELEGIDHVRQYLQAQFHADPERAVELLEIGPPFSSEGWVHRVWPNVRVLMTICSGPFASVIPKVKFLLGPNVPLRCSGYGASEATIAVPRGNTLDEFILRVTEVVEFLDVSQDEAHANLRQAWEVEVGKHYEPVLTTRDGLWRYRLGDIVDIVGFDAESSSPVIKYLGRRSLTMRLPHVQIPDYHLAEAIRTIQAECAIQVQEFTTMIDDRTLPSTVGFLLELMEPLGSNAQLVPQRLFDALVDINIEHERALKHGQMRLPTIRIVKAGTFAEYRHWRGEKVNIASAQIKVPLVLMNPTVQEWFLQKVDQEL